MSKWDVNFKPPHLLHSGIFHPTLRRLQEPNLELHPHNFMLPIFIVDDDDAVQKINSMPNVFRYGINNLKKFLSPLVEIGLSSVLLFGTPDKLVKDEIGSSADCSENPVIKAVPLLKTWFPNLLIACDVCMCPYTSHGHCGMLSEDGNIDQPKSVRRIAEIALSYAKAGAHIVAPSDMMDSRIAGIKKIFMENNIHNQVAILSYSCKFASSFYGPFREAAHTAPAFGNRKCYQLPPGSSGLAARAAARDVAEGADMLMVKPGLPYLDIVSNTKKTHPEYPLFVYQVSGEYAMLCHNEPDVLKPMLSEILLSFRRAGADCIITYFTPRILEWLQAEKCSK